MGRFVTEIEERLKNMSPAKVALTAICIGAGAFILLLVVFFAGWNARACVTTDNNTWGFIQAMSSVAAIAIAVGGGLMVLFQLVELTDSRERTIAMNNLQTYDAVFTLMMNDDNIEARRWIYDELGSDPATALETLDDDEHKKIKLVLNSLDYLGMMVAQDQLTSGPIIRWASPFVVKVWSKLGSYVAYEAERRGEPDYYEAARLLAEKCIALRKEKFGDTSWKRVEHAL